MAGADLLKKLQVKPDARLRLLNVPKQFVAELAAGGVTAAKAGTAFNGAIAFCETPADVTTAAKQILAKLPDDGLLWFAYRKGEAAKQSGLSRDVGWAALYDAGWRGVRSIAFDETWTGIRFRPQVMVKSKP